MNSTITAPSTSQSGATSANISPELMRAELVSSGQPRSRFYAWLRFIATSTQRSGAPISIVASAKSTTIEGIFAHEPTPALEELLSGPLFQVAGIFEIDEPGWADRHDEYIAETYL